MPERPKRRRAHSTARVKRRHSSSTTRSKRPKARQQAFQVGDHVTWNSEAGRVSGRIIKVHTRDVDHHGYVHHASKDAPQYSIKSDKTDHIALHKGEALRRVR